MFKIGERNYGVLRKVLWKNSILIAAEDVFGTAARTMYLHMDTGRVVIRSNGQCKDL
jgi:chemotaxis protein CheD